MTEDKKHPDFNEWLLTEDGKECNDITNLVEQPFLQNRLFWAFDAGRNCVWDQYIKQKSELDLANKEKDKRIKELEAMLIVSVVSSF